MTKTIERTMTFGELIQNFPNSGQIIAGYGLHCIGCHIGITESIEEGARAHGLSEDEINTMIKELNELAQ